MSTEYSNCPNCNAAIKSGFISNTSILNPEKINLINKYAEKKVPAYCTKCGENLYYHSKLQLTDELLKIKRELLKVIDHIPVITANSPLGWNYDTISIITAQSTTGTGVITEFTSSFNDIFGAQSVRHNEKLKNGEKLCLAQLRKQALNIGGNAVIATDIDYAEVGGGRGMLMVCMAGTAVFLKNLEVLDSERKVKMEEITQLHNLLVDMESFEIDDSKLTV